MFGRHPSLAPAGSVALTAGDLVSNIVAEGAPAPFGSVFSGNWFADWNGDGVINGGDTAAAAGFFQGAVGMNLVEGQMDRIRQRTEALSNLLNANPDLPLLVSTTYGPRQRFSSDQYSFRLDTDFNDGHDRIFGRWTQEFQDQNALNGDRRANRLGIFDPTEGSANNLALVYTHIFSLNVVNEARASWTKIRADALAIPDPLPSLVVIGATQISSFGAIADRPQLFTEHTFQYEDTISINAGSHGIQIGGEVRQNVENGLFDFSSRGSFYFYGLGDFVLDEPAVEAIAFSPDALSTSPVECATSGLNCNWEFPDMHRGFRNSEIGVFFSDDWKITSDFTLNWGLRYDLYGVPTEIQDRTTNLLFGSGSNIFERVATAPRFDPLGIKTGQVQFNPNLVPDMFEGDHNNFSPRLGFAWDPLGNGKTSIRGGYGIGYDRLFFNVTGNSRFNPPVHALGIFGWFFGNNVGDSYDIDNKLNRLPGQGSPPVTTALPISLRTLPPDIRTSYVQNGFFGFQRELSSDLMLEINYVTSLGRKLTVIEDYNRFVGDRFGAADPFGLDRPADRGQTRLHPDFAALNLRGNLVSSAYHAGQFQLRKRFAQSYAFQASYTFAKLIDTDSDVLGARGVEGNNAGVDDIYTMDATQSFLDRGLSVLDVNHRFAANAVWHLPFLRYGSGAAGKLFGGWHFNTIVTLQSGRPFSPLIPDTLANGDFSGSSGRPRDRPSGSFDRSLGGTPRSVFQRDVSGPPSCRSSISGESSLGSVQTIDPGCSSGFFAGRGFTSVLGGNGTIGRNTFRGPGFANVDFSVFRDIEIKDRLTIQLRAEFFNLFNRVNLLPTPEPLVTSPFFGTVGASFDAREIQFALKIFF